MGGVFMTVSIDQLLEGEAELVPIHPGEHCLHFEIRPARGGQPPADPAGFSRELGERLREIMANADVSGADLARACGVTEQAISGWQRTGRIGKRHLPVIATLTRVSLMYLLTGYEDTDGLDQEALAFAREFAKLDAVQRSAVRGAITLAQLKSRPR